MSNDDQHRLYEGLLASVPQDTEGVRDWSRADPYLLDHLPAHAVLAGRVDSLVTDVDFVIEADPARILPILDRARSREAREVADVYRIAHAGRLDSDPSTRRWNLALTAVHHGAEELARKLRPASDLPHAWPHWAGALPASTTDVLGGRTGPIWACASTVLRGVPVAVTTGSDTVIRVWDLSRGEQMTSFPTGHAGWVVGLACTVLAGRPVVVGACDDATVRIWEPDPDRAGADDQATREIGPPLRGHRGTVRSVACSIFDRRPIAVTGGADGLLAVWDLEHGVLLDLFTPRRPGSRLTAAPPAEVNAVACTTVNGQLVVATGDDEGLIRLWDLTRREEIGTLTGHQGWVLSIAGSIVDRRPILVSAGEDATVRVWDPARGEQIGDPLVGHAGPVWTVACATIRGRPVAVTGGRDDSARVWDLTRGEPAHVVRAPDAGRIWSLACAEVTERPVLVGCGDDGTVRRWFLDAIAAPASTQETPVAGEITAVTSLVVGGRGIAATVDDRHTMRCWDLERGEPFGVPASVPATLATALSWTTIAARPVLVTAEGNRLRTRDPETGAEGLAFASGHSEAIHALACATVNGNPTVVTAAGRESTLRCLDLTTGRRLHGLAGHRGRVDAIACVDTGDHAIAVSGGTDHTVRTWDLATGAQIDAPMTGHTGAIHALACLRLDNRWVAVTSGSDSTVRVWDLAAGEQVGDPMVGHTGRVTSMAAATVGTRPIAVTGGEDGTLRFWDLRRRRQLQARPMSAPITSVTIVNGVWSVVRVGTTVAVFSLSSRRSDTSTR
ncbi:WD40 repeat domain-containing protein [Embleya sp. NPDC001921]